MRDTCISQWLSSAGSCRGQRGADEADDNAQQTKTAERVAGRELKKCSDGGVTRYKGRDHCGTANRKRPKQQERSRQIERCGEQSVAPPAPCRPCGAFAQGRHDNKQKADSDPSHCLCKEGCSSDAGQPGGLARQIIGRPPAQCCEQPHQHWHRDHAETARSAVFLLSDHTPFVITVFRAFRLLPALEWNVFADSLAATSPKVRRFPSLDHAAHVGAAILPLFLFYWDEFHPEAGNRA